MLLKFGLDPFFEEEKNIWPLSVQQPDFSLGGVKLLMWGFLPCHHGAVIWFHGAIVPSFYCHGAMLVPWCTHFRGIWGGSKASSSDCRNATGELWIPRHPSWSRQVKKSGTQLVDQRARWWRPALSQIPDPRSQMDLRRKHCWNQHSGVTEGAETQTNLKLGESGKIRWEGRQDDMMLIFSVNS